MINVLQSILSKGMIREAHPEITPPTKILFNNFQSIKYSPKPNKYLVPLYSSGISAGFPSPADDYKECDLDIADYLIKNPSSTFLVRVKGESMKNAGINSGALLVVDRSLAPKPGMIVVAVLNGQFTVKKLVKEESKYFLMPENKLYRAIEIKDDLDIIIWGVVTKVINDLT